MKKNLLFLSLMAMSFGLFAQGDVVWKNAQGSAELPDTVTLTMELGHNDIVFDATISNVSSNDLNVYLKRTIVSYVHGAGDQLCYGTACQAGDENKPEIETSATTQNANTDVSTTDPYDMIHYTPLGFLGTTKLKYYIFTESDSGDDIAQDSVIVEYVKDFLAISFLINMSDCPGFDKTGDVVVSGTFGNDIVLTPNFNNTKYTGWALATAGTTYTYKYTWGNEVSANYEVSVSDTADGKTDDIWLVGINDKAYFPNLKIYPNPFNNTLTIENIENAAAVEISNILGQTVYSTSRVGNKLRLSTDELNTGMYFVKITDAKNNTYTERIIKR